MHWEVQRLKYVAKILPSNVDKHIYPDEVQVRLCNYTDVYYNDYITVDTVLQKGSCKESEFTKFVLRKGDVIITKDSETPDDIGVPTFVKDDLENVVCGYHLTMIRPYACRGEFIFRFIQSDRTRRYFELNSNGITRYGLGKSSIENLLLPIPTNSEQTQIVDFLDRKTEQIDELIRIKERRIELLQAQRTALINQAVTKGLDPNVEMKPSGVEGIGEIPKDHGVTRLKYICESIVDCEHKTAPTQETGYPLIRTPNIGIGHLVLDGVNRVSEATYQEWSRRTIPQSGDLILAREAPVGNVAIIPKDLKVCLGQRTVLIIPDKNKVCSMFLVYLMLGDEIQAKLLGRSTGAIVHHLNMTDIRNLELPRLPALPTQRKIVDFLNRKTEQIDELIAAEHQKIELLKEYRQSLISEAVTGKIDVRNEV